MSSAIKKGILILIIFVSACEEDNLSFLTTRSYSFVEVQDITPVSGSADISRITSVTLSFSQPIDIKTFNSAFSLYGGGQELTAQDYSIVEWQNDNKTVWLAAPAILLNKNIIYTIKVDSDLRSADGNPLEKPYTTSFATGVWADLTPPTLLSHCVISGVTCVSPVTGIINPVDGVKFVFSETMLPWTVNSAFSFKLNGVKINPSSTNYSQTSFKNDTVVFRFSSVSLGSAKINMTNKAMDLYGNPLDAASVISNETFDTGGQLPAPTGLTGAYTLIKTNVTIGVCPVCTSYKVPTDMNITVKWNAVSGATSYQVLRSTTGAAGSYAVVSNQTIRTFVQNVTINYNLATVTKTFYYKIKALNAGGTQFTSPATPVVMVTYTYNRLW